MPISPSNNPLAASQLGTSLAAKEVSRITQDTLQTQEAATVTHYVKLFNHRLDLNRSRVPLVV